MARCVAHRCPLCGRPRCLRGTDPSAARRRGTACVRPRTGADHHPRPWRAWTATFLSYGARTWRSELARSIESGASTRRFSGAATRRIGCAVTLLEAPRFGTWRAPGSITAAAPRTRPSPGSHARLTNRGGPLAVTTGARAPPHRSVVSCARSRAAHGTRSGAGVRSGSCSARTRSGACARRLRTGTRENRFRR